MKLENWGVVSIPSNPCQAPELGIMCLSGEIYNSTKFKDGTSVTTSEVIGKDGDMVVTYSGSKYELGQPHPTYEEKFPNARDRLLKSLTLVLT